MIVLRRLDPARRMARFYTLSLQRSLFGETMLVRRWGRIGSHGQIRHDWFDDRTEAAAALSRLAATKARRGYQLLGADGWDGVPEVIADGDAAACPGSDAAASTTG
jgi:predicted DNA-binding WGR domain protein